MTGHRLSPLLHTFHSITHPHPPICRTSRHSKQTHTQYVGISIVFYIRLNHTRQLFHSTLSLSLSLSLTHTHNLSLTHPHTLSISLSRTPIHTISLTHTDTLSLTHSLHSLSFSLTHTHIHTLSHRSRAIGSNSQQCTKQLLLTDFLQHFGFHSIVKLLLNARSS